MYQAENTVASLGKTFALLAILITALGVFGLAAYTAEQKTKEIGIRKVLGASIPNLVSSFLSLFLKIFFIASVIAIPLAYIIAYKWLEDFAYRSPISPMVFILSLAGLLIITFLTVSYTTLKAARNNPVEALRMD
jgi:putative ABC transport system permease protein